MLFKPELLEKVLAGTKTQTRRLCKPGEYTFMKGCMDKSRGYVAAYSEICHRNHKRRFVDGRTYAACPGRGKVQQCKIRIVRMWREDVRNIIDEDVKAEGFENIWDFLVVWMQINDPAGYKQFQRMNIAVHGGKPNGVQSEGLAAAFMYQRPRELYTAWALMFELVK